MTRNRLKRFRPVPKKIHTLDACRFKSYLGREWTLLTD
jgi:hypothetical protein